MEFQWSYSKSWKMMLWKCCTQMPANLENSAVATGLERSVFIPIPKKGNAKECSNYCTIALISHASKLTLKILQASFNSTWTVNFQVFKLDLEKAEEAEIKWPTPVRLLKKHKSFRKTSASVLLTMPKPLTVWITTNWEILKEMGIPDHLTCFLRNLYAGQEATVRKLVLEKAEEPEIKLPTSDGSSKKQESSRKTSISVLLTMPKPLTVWITINCGKLWKRWAYQTTWPP